MTAAGRRRIFGFYSSPLTINNQFPNSSSNTLITARLFVPLSNTSNPQLYGANRNGTITSITLHSTTSTTVRFVTGTPNVVGNSFTYTAVSGSIAVSTGINTYSVSLTCNAGDVLGFWTTSSASSARYGSNTFLDVYGSGTSVTPVPGQSAAISIAQGNSDLVLYGRG